MAKAKATNGKAGGTKVAEPKVIGPRRAKRLMDEAFEVAIEAHDASNLESLRRSEALAANWNELRAFFRHHFPGGKPRGEAR